MKQCPHCERSCPDETMVCPHCGYLFSAEMQGERWQKAPWRPDMDPRRPHISGCAGSVRPTDTGAVLAFLFGAAATIGAWFLAGIPLTAPGLICGITSLRRIRKAAGSRAGEAAAQAGIALCVLALGIGAFMLIRILTRWPSFYREFPSAWDSTVRRLRS